MGQRDASSVPPRVLDELLALAPPMPLTRPERYFAVITGNHREVALRAGWRQRQQLVDEVRREEEALLAVPRRLRDVAGQVPRGPAD